MLKGVINLNRNVCVNIMFVIVEQIVNMVMGTFKFFRLLVILKFENFWSVAEVWECL